MHSCKALRNQPRAAPGYQEADRPRQARNKGRSLIIPNAEKRGQHSFFSSNFLAGGARNVGIQAPATREIVIC